MKKYLIGLIVLLGTVVQAQEIQWMTLAEALEAQRQSLRKYLWMSTPNGVVLVNY